MEAKGKDSKLPSHGTPRNIHVNWMEEGIINEVRHQDHCDCCWAIVSTAAIECLYNIKNQPKDLFRLSAQELINCVKPEETSCYSASINRGYRYAMNYGIRREVDCPFMAKKQPCLDKSNDMPALRIKNFKRINDGDEIGLLEVVKNQPVGAAILITKPLKEYKEGIYEGPEIYDIEKMMDYRTHAVLVVGYGSDEETGKNFWWIMNSWDSSWGIKGFAKIIRNSSLPKDRVPVLFRASYPTNVEYFLCSEKQITK